MKATITEISDRGEMTINWDGYGLVTYFVPLHKDLIKPCTLSILDDPALEFNIDPELLDQPLLGSDLRKWLAGIYISDIKSKMQIKNKLSQIKTEIGIELNLDDEIAILDA